VRNCLTDEGRPLGTSLQEQVSNHLRLEPKQDAKTPYPSMAPLDQYLIADRDAEIALARSAAPGSISRDAEVMVLGRHGYETVVKGKNGFVCMVWRSWAAAVNAQRCVGNVLPQS